MDHSVYLALAIVTHAILGYALVRVLTPAPPFVGALAGVSPDVDLLFGHAVEFPFVHRGVTHTPLFLVAVLIGLFLVGVAVGTGLPEGVLTGVGVGVFSHLVIDSFTAAGVMWLYPVSTRPLAYDVSVHSVAGNALLWLASVGLVYWGGRDRLGRRSSR